MTEDFGSDQVKIWSFPKGKVVDEIDNLRRGDGTRRKGKRERESRNSNTDSYWAGSFMSSS
jgi:hypothetical protein